MVPTQRANGSTPDPEPAPDTSWVTTEPATPSSGGVAALTLLVGTPIAILVSVAIGSALVAGSLWVIRWAWDTIGGLW